MTVRVILSIGLIAASIGIQAHADQMTIQAHACIEPPTGAHEQAADELVKYKVYTRDTIEPAWSGEMMRQSSSLWFGEVRIRCTVHSDGTLTDQKLTVGESASPLFKNVCINSLKNAPRFKPFSDALLKETGSSYTDDFDFTISRGEGPAYEAPAQRGVKQTSPSAGPD